MKELPCAPECDETEGIHPEGQPQFAKTLPAAKYQRHEQRVEHHHGDTSLKGAVLYPPGGEDVPNNKGKVRVAHAFEEGQSGILFRQRLTYHQQGHEGEKTEEGETVRRPREPQQDARQ